MTITLESISKLLERGFIDAYDDPCQVKASIDAAIRERDRLRGDVSGMTEELLHVPSREEWRELQKRAERAEAELAALKARIAGSDAGIVTQTFSHLGSDGADTTTVEAYPPKVFHSTAIGQRVRLVVEE